MPGKLIWEHKQRNSYTFIDYDHENEGRCRRISVLYQIKCGIKYLHLQIL